MKEIRLVVCDLDGTLLHEDKSLDTQIKDVLKEKDLAMTLVSGRNSHIMQDIVQELNITLPYICNNGANIFQGNQCIYDCPIDANELERSLLLLKQRRAAYLAYSHTTIYSYGHQPGLDRFRKRLEGKCLIVEDASIEDILKESIFKVVMIHPEMEDIKAALNTQNKKTLCIQSEGYVYTLTNKKANKADALKKLLEIIHIPANQVLAFGDNYNDAPMFEVVDGVAMGNAVDPLKERARYQTSSNEEDGVSAFIKDYL